MNELDIMVSTWLEAAGRSPSDSLTQASLRMDATVDEKQLILTEVHDSLARTVRPHIYVPAYPLARWFLLNWWRLRWEPTPQRRTHQWSMAHSLGAVGQGVAWPPLVFSSDGDFVQVEMTSERQPDVAGIRYLNEAVFDVPAAAFERAMDRFLDQVEERLSACGHQNQELRELRSELSEERGDPGLAYACRMQALAGLDPGDADEHWLNEVRALSDEIGASATDEVMAVLPELGGQVSTAREGVETIRQSRTEVDLSWVPQRPGTRRPELPWQRGERLAPMVRKRLGLGEDKPVSDGSLGDGLGLDLPVEGASRKPLAGGFRGSGSGHTTILTPSMHPLSQRFFLARLIGCAAMSPPGEGLLPVVRTHTALQKGERAFAQEFLCPWSALDAFTEESGTDDEGVEEAASYFQISTWAVRSSLVNHGKLSRERLPA